jgi:excisionase family DNA binding protein
MTQEVQMKRNDRLFLRAIEVAEELGISRALAYRWMSEGTLPTVRVGGTVRVPLDALLEWVKANTRAGVAA